MRLPLLFLLLAAAVMAQQTAPANQAPTNASVSGVIKDKATGKPLADYVVSTFTNSTYVGNTAYQSGATRQVQSTTDSLGRYKLTDLPPGPYRINARDAQRFGNGLTRRVALSGQDLEDIDFQVVVDGKITGKVLDENKEPVPGASVRLISREYYLGTAGYFFKASAQTNDQGEYTLSRVAAGHPYFIEVDKLERSLPAHSEVPLDPRLRKHVPMRTWYPNSPYRESAQSITLRPGEQREDVDIEVKKSPSSCVEGVVEGPAGPAAMRFTVEAQQPSSGTSNGMGMFVAAPGGMTGDDGQFRICDLYPGVFRLTANDVRSNPQQGPTFGVTTITVSDQDLRGVKLATSGGTHLEGEVVWDGEAPATPVTAKIGLSLQALLRSQFQGEKGRGGRLDIPGPFSLDGLLVDDYAINATIPAPGLYIKDVTYGSRSVMYEPLRVGTAMNGVGLRVTVGHDGGTLSAGVQDKDGHPVGDISVLILPADARSEGELSARLVQGATDQLGQYTSQTLRPGKYYVVATEDSVDFTPESIGKLWRARNRFQEAEVPPSGSAAVKLEPVKLSD